MSVPLLLPSALHDVLVRARLLAGLGALGGLAPGRTGVSATRGPAFTAPHGMVDRVHGDTADRGAFPLPAVSACLSDGLVLMLEIPDLPDGGATAHVNHSHFPARQSQGRVLAFARHQLRSRPGRSDELGAFFRLQFDRVHDRAQRLLRSLLEHSVNEALRLEAKRLLIDLLEREKEWQDALDVVQPLIKQQPAMRRPASHWLCELAQQEIDQSSRAMARKHLKKALQLDERCIRATLMLAELEMDNGHYAKAIERLNHIPQQDIAHVPTMLPALQRAYTRNNNLPGLESHLYKLLGQAPYTSVIVTLGELVHQRDGVDSAIERTGGGAWEATFLV